MTNLLDMLTTVIFIAVPTLVGTGVMVAVVGWSVGLYQKIVTAQAEVERARASAAAEAAMREIEVQRQALLVDLIQPNEAGLLPVTKADIAQNGRALITLAAQYIDAHRAQPVMPQTLTYSPHIAHAKSDAKALEVNELAQLMAPADNKPMDFWQLYHAEQLPARGFLLGFDLETNEPITADWRKLYSALIGGQSGSGKSTLVRNILAQAALQGGRFVVVDPHANAGEESLAHSLQPMERLMLMPPAGDDEQIRSALKFVAQVVKNRLAGQDPDRTPLILVADELTGMLARGNVADELLATLGLIAQESRKVAVYALGLGQQFHADLFPSVVRNSFVSYLSCRARQDTARAMSGSTEFAKIAAKLTTGQTVWMTPQGEIHRLSVPNCTQHHLELVAQEIESNGHFQRTSNALPTLPEATSSAAALPAGGSCSEVVGKLCGSASTTGAPDAAQITLIHSLIQAGKSKTEIIKEVWGVNGGRQFQIAAREYDEAVRTIIMGGAAQQLEQAQNYVPMA